MRRQKISDSEIKDILIGILEYFDEVCKKHKIRYSLAYGTLIGAARHKGFIPWDDDIDVIIPQDDYIKMLTLPEFNDSSVSHYLLHSAQTEAKFKEKYVYPFAKLMDERTEAEFIRTKDSGGAFIDIFPVTGLPHGEENIEAHFKYMDKNKKGIYIGNRKDADIQKSLILFVKEIRRSIYYKFYEKYRTNLIKKAFYNKFVTSEMVAVSVWNYGIKEVIPRRLFDEYTELEFEGKKYPCIKNYDEYLTLIYHDWRKLPPVEEQVAHHEYSLYYK